MQISKILKETTKDYKYNFNFYLVYTTFEWRKITNSIHNCDGIERGTSCDMSNNIMQSL